MFRQSAAGNSVKLATSGVNPIAPDAPRGRQVQPAVGRSTTPRGFPGFRQPIHRQFDAWTERHPGTPWTMAAWTMASWTTVPD